MYPGRKDAFMSDTTQERYDPLPDLSQMPKWVWRRLPRAGRVALAAGPIVGLAAVLALAPGIDRAKDERAQTEAQRAEQTRAERVLQVREEQRPRFAAGAPAGSDPVARARLLDAAGASILADARTRGARPAERAACEPFPRGSGERAGRYACLAVIHDVRGARAGAAVGYPYRLLVDFESGRYGFCKVVGRPGEAMIATQPFVPLSRQCGGM
jgi:hypothetical protein